MPSTVRRGDLNISYNSDSGQILRVHDRRLQMDVITFQPGHELEINRHPARMRLLNQDDMPDHHPAWQCNLQADDYCALATARGFDIFRQVVVGSGCNPGGNHINPPQSMHIRYRLDRRRIDRATTADPLSTGVRPIQAPLWLDTVGTLCARTDWFGTETKMMQASIGGCGPRSHVSLEDGAPAEVVEHLWNPFRRSHPSVQTIPGAAYYHPDGRWLWITCQRPSVGMHWDFETDALKAQFQYHARLEPAETIHTPEVSLYWGRGGRDEMLARMNDQFIGYTEPKDWFYHTTWYWLHWWQYRPGGFAEMAEQVRFLHEHLGLTGFGITGHDVRPGAWDCGPSSLRPSPHWGGDEGMSVLGETVKEIGGKMYVWMPFLGLSQPGNDLRDDWRVKGEDGRAYESFYIGSYDMYHAVNYGHPEVQKYYLDWIRRYIVKYNVEGIFWDCGGAGMPPDFSDPSTRPFQRFPSENMTAPYQFMEKVMQVGQECSPDFFMWHECVSTDLPGTGYSSHTGNDMFLCDLSRAGRNRLVFRSCSTYNIYGGFATVDPKQDTVFQSPLTIESLRQMANDEMNKWVVQFVREHGTREAVGIANGVAVCADHVIVDPAKEQREITVPKWAAEAKMLTNVFTGEKIKPSKESDEGSTFRLDGKAAYEIET